MWRDPTDGAWRLLRRGVLVLALARCAPGCFSPPPPSPASPGGPADPCAGPGPRPASCPVCVGPCTELVCALLTCFDVTCDDCCYGHDGSFSCG